MTDLTVAEFRARFPEFTEATYPDVNVQAIIEDTLCMFSQSRWDCNYKRGHSLYVAHLLELQTNQANGNSGTGGLNDAQTKSVDGVSVGYAVVTPDNFNDAFFAGTSYGREYLMIRKMVGIGATCVTLS